LSDQVLRFLIAHDPALDSLHFVPAAHAAALVAFSQLVDATDPDLSAFAARGGKLILWHGLADYGVSARSTIRYYERVVGTLGDQAAADRFIRFYTSPAVGHLNDGPGGGTIDFLGALTGWVETGAAPADLIATKPGDASHPAPVTRLVCRYPAYSHYTGAGNPSDATSFRCLRVDDPINRGG
jgi:feruloyl esterase